MRLALLISLALTLCAQPENEEYRVYTDHPRLLLTAQRLRLLKRERERESQRWRQFDSLVKGGVNFPEPGFALALYYAVSADATAGKRALDWALGSGNDLRQLALVYDWCQPLLDSQQSAALSAKIRQRLEKSTGDTLAARRDRILALISIADDARHAEEAPLRHFVESWWRINPDLPPLPGAYALMESLHALRDNLKIDLRERAPDAFAHFPIYLISANYPAPYRAPQNEFRIPMYPGSGAPDLNAAALARAAGLSMVDYNTNDLDNQFLQGWLIQDRFIMLTPFGAPYEFLWADPYQPGLSFYQLPLIFHDSASGTLFVRSAWDEDADWFGLYQGDAELFHDGRAGPVKPGATLRLGETTIVSGHIPLQFSMQGGTILVTGQKPFEKYLVETDDEEMREVSADRAGTFILEYPVGRTAGVRVHEPWPSPSP